MRDVFDAAAELQTFCAEAQWRFCFIGGLAVQRWGQPRFTRDADLTLLTGFGDEEAYVSSLLRRFAPRIENAAAFAVANRVLLLKSAAGVGLDIALAGLPFEEAMIQRASTFLFPHEIQLTTCSPQLEANPERAPTSHRAQGHSRNSRAGKQIP